MSHPHQIETIPLHLAKIINQKLLKSNNLSFSPHIEYNNKFKLYIIILIIIYVLCFTNIMPSEVRLLINKPITKGIIFSYITYLAKTNLGGSLILTTIYFITTICDKSRKKNNYKLMLPSSKSNIHNIKDTIKKF